MPAGRPTKLTPAIQEGICRSVRAGSTPAWACRRHDVDDSTLRRWKMVATAAASKKMSQQSQHERRCVAFFTELDKAEADSYTAMVGLVFNGAQQYTQVTTTTDAEGTTTTTTRTMPGDWRAAAHLASRRFPKDMGDRQQIELTGAEGGPVKVVTNEEVWEELEAIRRAKVAAGAGNGNGHGTPVLSP